MRSTVFVILDSMRRDHLGAYNDDIDFTGHLDDIAADSLVYDDAVAQAPWTLPSHSSMFTGLYPWEHEATNKKAHLETEETRLAEKFREEEYITAAITPNIWVTPHKGLTDGFTEVENFLGVGSLTPFQKLFRAGSRVVERMDERLRRPLVEPLERLTSSMDIDTTCRSEETIDAAVEFLETHAEDRFFLFVNLMEPHEPYDPPQEYLDRHDVQDLSGVPDDNEDFFTGETDWAELQKAYRASVDYTDDLIGRLDRTLSENGLDDTVLAVAGDHGQALGEEEFFGHQFTVRDEVVSVPLMVRHPEEPSGREERLVELRELYWLLPKFAGIGEYDDVGSAAVPGGYEFPQVFRRYISEERMDYYYRKYRYCRTSEEKITKSEQEDGTVSYTRRDRSTGEQLPVEDEHRHLVDNLGDVSGDDPLDTTDEEAVVEDRLEELGYL